MAIWPFSTSQTHCQPKIGGGADLEKAALGKAPIADLNKKPDWLGKVGKDSCSDQVPFNQVQVRGSHNSYHKAPKIPLSSKWKYTHPPLGYQLGQHGLQHFELDLYWDGGDQQFDVYHVPVVDDRTTCSSFQDCLADMARWTRQNPNHYPIVVQLEIKSQSDSTDTNHHWARALDAEIRNQISDSALMTPDQLVTPGKTLRETILTDGWPIYRDLRGKIFFILLADTNLTSAYTEGPFYGRNKAMFPYGDGETHYSAFIKYDDPIRQYSQIQRRARQGFMIRSRADADLDYDLHRQEKALSSGAHFLASDYFRPHDRKWFRFEEKTAWRCNPLFHRNTTPRLDNGYGDQRELRYWTEPFSEEYPGLGLCRQGYTVTGISCSGRYCDNLSLRCSYQPNFRADIGWSRVFSEETPFEMDSRYHVSGVKCFNDYCDNKRLHYVQLNRPLQRSGCYDTEWFSEENGPVVCEQGYAVSGMQCDYDYCDNISLHCCSVR